MTLPRYLTYKNSGVDWLGEVPEHWELKRLKYTSAVIPSNVDKKSHEGEAAVVLCNYTDVYYNDFITSAIAFMPATASSDQIVRFTLRADDVIITKDSETADDIAISAYVPNNLPGVVCGYHLSIVRPRPTYSGAFIKRLFDSVYARSCFTVLANGLTRFALGQYELDNVVFPFPPFDEQEIIASFLDRETAKIDKLVRDQQRLIELLNEKLQAVISRAITKGLNPDLPTKPSGIEWFGEVPKHWEVKRIGAVLSDVKAGPFGSSLTKDMYASSGYRVYGQEQVIPGDFTVGDYFIAEDKYEALAQYRVQPGDILISCVGTYGRIAIVPADIEPGIINPRLIRLRSTPDTNEEYLAELLRSHATFEQFKMLSRGGTMDVINIGTLREIIVVMPPVEEQLRLLRFLRDERARVETLISEAQEAVGLLRERRTALISAAVTGKIDVRSSMAAAAA